MSMRKTSREIMSDKEEMLRIHTDFYKSPYNHTELTLGSTMKTSPDRDLFVCLFALLVA